MSIKPELLGAAIFQREVITSAVLKAVGDAPKGFTDTDHIAMAAGSTMDGILAALAWVAAGSQMYQGARERRLFADEVRKGLLKFMSLAEQDAEKGIDWEAGPSLPN